MAARAPCPAPCPIPPPAAYSPDLAPPWELGSRGGLPFSSTAPFSLPSFLWNSNDGAWDLAGEPNGLGVVALDLGRPADLL
jgi:hypothetical protein